MKKFVEILTNVGYSLCAFMTMLLTLMCIDPDLVPYWMFVLTAIVTTFVLVVKLGVLMFIGVKKCHDNALESAIGTKEEEKEIHFYKDYSFNVDVTDLFITHEATKLAIDNNVKVIHTVALTLLSFDLLDSNYKIYLHENNRVLECKPGMDGTEKDIRRAHNILKIVVADVFDDYFYNDENKTENVDAKEVDTN